MIGLLAVGLLGVGLLYFVWKSVILPFMSPLNQIPTVPRTSLSQLLLGQFGEIMRSPPCRPQLKWTNTYKSGMIHYHALLGEERVFVSDLKLVKHILLNPKTFIKPKRQVREIQRITGNGLLASDGAVHKHHRRVLSKHFHFANLKDIVPTFTQKTQELVDLWRARLAGPDAPKTLELHSEFSRFTLDVIGASAFGYEFNAMRSQSTKLYEAYGKLLVGLTPWRLATFVLPVLKKLPIKANTEQDEAIAIVRATVKDVVAARKKAAQASHSSEHHTLLDIMLSPESEEDFLSEDEIVAEVMTFLVAGHETTSNGLCWTWHLLSQHPDAQTKAREEVLSVLGPNVSNPNLSWEDISTRMPYLTAVIKESLRLFPPAPLTLRYANEDTSLEMDGKAYPIPKGTTLFVSPFVMQHMDANFPDPEEFRPERFLQDPLPRMDGYLPFLAGPRSCVGSRFAMAEMQVSMAVLLANFSMAPSGEPVKPKLAITMRPSPGLSMVVTALDV